MTYHKARNCFKEGTLKADKDSQAHNLNTGLSVLSQAIEGDFYDLKRRLDQIESDLRRLKNR